jgi:hypothetical protein
MCIEIMIKIKPHRSYSRLVWLSEFFGFDSWL